MKIKKLREFFRFLGFGLLTVCLLLSTLAIPTIHKEHKWNQLILDKDDGMVYLSLQHESNPLKLPNDRTVLQQFEQLYENLHIDDTIYYEIYQQPLGRAKGRFYDIDSDTLETNVSSTMCVQISKNVPKDFDLTVAQGRLFEEADFHLSKGKAIPVLMGSAYQGVYQPGDTFQAEYLFVPYTFQIVGILDDGCALAHSGFTIDLEHAVIMPSVSYDDWPESETEWQSRKIHEANRVSGNFKLSQEQISSLYPQIRSIASSAGVGTFSLSASVWLFPIRWGIDTGLILLGVCVLAALLLTVEILCLRRFLQHIGWKKRRKITYVILLFLLSALIVLPVYLLI